MGNWVRSWVVAWIYSLSLMSVSWAVPCTTVTKNIQAEINQIAKSRHAVFTYQLENQTPIVLTVGGSTKTTQFLMASVSKMFYAFAALRFVDSGLMSLDDKVEKFSFKLWGDAKLRHLLNHRSGIPEYLNSNALDWSVPHTYPAILKALSKKPDFLPNEMVEYSNTNYLILDKWLTEVTGLPRKTVLAQQLFDLVGMTRSGLIESKQPSTVLGATGANFANLGGAGNAYSTAEDLLLFLQAIEDGRFLSAKATDWIAKEDPSCSGLTECWRTSMGMSHRVGKIAGKDFVYKSGSFRSTSNAIGWVPDTRQKLVFVSDVPKLDTEDTTTRWLNAYATCE